MAELRRKEMAWLAAHPEILLGYWGQWIAVEGEKIIASGFDEVSVEEAARRRVNVPFVFRVPTPEDLPLAMALDG